MNAKIKEAMYALNDALKMTTVANETVTVQREDLLEIVTHLFFTGEEWNNQSALGYAITAAESVGLNKIDTSTLIGEMQAEFDSKSLEEAAEVYQKFEFWEGEKNEV